MRKPFPATIDQVQKAANDWNFNCGPGALCAVLNLTPDQLRPHLGDFEQKGYTNPTLMLNVLTSLGATVRQVYRADAPCNNPPTLEFGVMRVQWGGPWTKPGVPMRVRYRQTHWIAASGDQAFDVNAMCVGGWMPWSEWSKQLVPWLIKECCPKGDGTWWITHAWEVKPRTH